MKKFYHMVSTERDGDAFTVALDGRRIKTPGKREVVMPSGQLAQAVAQEWEAQGDDIDPETMPLTQLVNTSLDRVAPRMEEVVQELVAFGDTDLLCYRDGDDPDIFARQGALWDPAIEAFSAKYGINIQTTSGVMPVKQDPALRKRLIEIVREFDSYSLTAFHACVSGLGSIILALAVFGGDMTLKAAWKLSILEQTLQEERWGTDSEVEEKRQRVYAEVKTGLDLRHYIQG